MHEDQMGGGGFADSHSAIGFGPAFFLECDASWTPCAAAATRRHQPARDGFARLSRCDAQSIRTHAGRLPQRATFHLARFRSSHPTVASWIDERSWRTRFVLASLLSTMWDTGRFAIRSKTCNWRVSYQRHEERVAEAISFRRVNWRGVHRARIGDANADHSHCGYWLPASDGDEPSRSKGDSFFCAAV